MEPRKGPTGYEDEAAKAAAAGNFALAADLYDAANGATIGHKRGERYQQAAQNCREKAAAMANECPTCCAKPGAVCTQIAADTHWEGHYMHDARREAPAK